MLVRREDACTDAVRRVPHVRRITPATAPAVPHPQRGRGPPTGHGDREGVAVLLSPVPRRLDARRLSVPGVRLRRRYGADRAPRGRRLLTAIRGPREPS